MDCEGIDEETFAAVNNVISQNAGPASRKGAAKGKMVVESKQPAVE